MQTMSFWTLSSVIILIATKSASLFAFSGFSNQCGSAFVSMSKQSPCNAIALPPWRRFYCSINKSSMAALILSWDDKDDEEALVDECLLKATNNNLARLLIEDPEKTASLARLAVAFSPSDRAVHLKDIEHVEVLKVDESHIEIIAVVCENDGCVTLFVPVAFPKNCGSRITEECVMENLSVLDETALVKIQEMDSSLEKNHDDFSQQQQFTTNTRKIDFPSWWIQPQECKTSSDKMIQECKTIQEMLNRDTFQDEVRALATRGLEFLMLDYCLDVREAKVVAVGPAGFFFQANAKDENGNSYKVDIPYEFEGNLVMDDAPSLRAAVLGAVAAAIAS